MPLPQIYRAGGSGFQGFNPSSSSSPLSVFGQSKASGGGGQYFAPKVDTSQPRQPAFFEKAQVDAVNGLGWAVQQPARIAERPLAAANVFTGGAVGNAIGGIGNIGGSGDKPGPIGSVLNGLGSALETVGNFLPAIFNSSDAAYLARYGNQPDNFVLPGNPLGIGGGTRNKGLFGLGGPMTIKDLKDELAARGFNRTADGTLLDWSQVIAQAQQNPYQFGDRALSDQPIFNAGMRLVADPTNLLVFLPVGGWVAGGAKALRASELGSKVIVPTLKVAEWAKPALTPVQAGLKGLSWGHGYLRDMSYLGARATSLPGVGQSARAMLAGNVAYGSLRGLATAYDLALRGSKALFLPGFQASRDVSGALKVGKTLDALKGSYFKGALRLQVGSVAAEFASGRMNDIVNDAGLGGTIFDGLTNTVHDTLQKINNDQPLSKSEVFTILAAVTMPTVHTIKGEIGAATSKVSKFIGDNDAVLFARKLVPDVKGKAAVDEMYKRFGNGDIERGQQVFHWVLDNVDAHLVNHSMSLMNKTFAAMESVANRAAFLRPLIISKIERARSAGILTAKKRLDAFEQIVRYGGIDAPRDFEFNATPDQMIASWSRLHEATSKFADPLLQFGDLTLQRSQAVTKEMIDELRQIIKSDGTNGRIDRNLAYEILSKVPGLMEDPAYGSFWQELAVKGADTSGRAPEKMTNGGITVDAITKELDALYEKVPAEADLFHEAKQLEAAQAKDVKPVLERMRRVHSMDQLKALREDTTGNMQTLRRQQRVLANLRNNEFTRNGKPKYNDVNFAHGYNMTLFQKDHEGVFRGGHDGTGFIVNPDGMIETFGTYGRMHSEALVKAVEFGGRHVILEREPSQMVGEFYAAHGFVEIGHYKDGGTALVYVGGDPAALGSRLTHAYTGKTKIAPVDSTYRGMALEYEVPAKPELVSTDYLARFIEVDREQTPKTGGDYRYLDELTQEISRSGVIQPLTLTFDPIDMRAVISDGNHRIAAARRLGIKRVPVEIEIGDLGRPVGGGGLPHSQGHYVGGLMRSDVLTASELIGEIRSSFPKYRPSTRIYKSVDSLDKAIQNRITQSSLSTPSMEAIGPSPFNPEGTFHGSPREFDQFANEFRNANDFIGAGVFTTDSFNIAKGYALRNDSTLGYYAGGRHIPPSHLYRIDVGDHPQVIHMKETYPRDLEVDVKVPAGQKFFNLHDPIPEPLRKEIQAGLDSSINARIDRMNAIRIADVNDYLHGGIEDLRGLGWDKYVPPSVAEEIMAELTALDHATASASDGATQIASSVSPTDIAALAYKVSEITDKYVDNNLDPRAFAAGEYLSQTITELGAVIEDGAAEAKRQRYTAGTGFDLFRRIYDDAQNFDYDSAPLNNMIRDVFMEHGYDGFVHIGSIVTSDGSHPHGVAIWFDANKVNVKERVRTDQIVPTTPARYKLITDTLNGIRDKMRENQKVIAAIDQRTEELRTIKLPEGMTEIPIEQQNKLREVISQQHQDYPELTVSIRGSGPVLLDPADGPIAGLQLERNMYQSLLYDYGPLSKMSAIYNALFSPVSSRRLARDARQSVFNLAIGNGAKASEVNAILGDLNARVRENTVGVMRVPYWRGITALPANAVNSIAKQHLSETAWARITARYGENGFHRLLDEASNQLVRSVDNAARRGTKIGALARALREGYRMWEYAPIVGSGTRIVSKTWYHIFRFMMDVRWHLLNNTEADLLALFREGAGATRFGPEPLPVSKNATLAHTAIEDLPSSFFSGNATTTSGPAHAMELFDAGLYIHNRMLMPVLERSFDKTRLESVNSVLDSLPENHPVIQMLNERFGTGDGKLWSQQLDDMMYSFDTRGVDKTVADAFAKVADESGWTKEEMAAMAPVVERISELNQKSFDDIVGLYQGNLNRNRVERILNSYWLYWPLSYQLKAAKWMFDVMLTRMAGKETNLLGAALFTRAADEFKQSLARDPGFAQQMKDESDLWFAASMLFPITPMDLGVTLNKGVRYVGSLVEPEFIPPYKSVNGAEDIPGLMLEMGPVYTANLLKSVVEDFQKAEKRKNATPGWVKALID